MFYGLCLYGQTRATEPVTRPTHLHLNQRYLFHNHYLTHRAPYEPRLNSLVLNGLLWYINIGVLSLLFFHLHKGYLVPVCDVALVLVGL